MSTIKAELNSFLKGFSLKLVFIIGALYILMAFYVKAKIVSPIKRITEAVKNSANRGSIEHMSAISALNLGAEGEIENILKSSVKVFSDRQSLDSKMQEEQKDVMLAFATLIKNVNIETIGYDDYAPDYVRIITEEMSKTDRYKDVLTESVRNNIILAAPLHDVGKLAVPDEILYKPARLTDEEFEIVKQHAEYGAKIIEETAKDLPKTEHLEMAKKIAWAHHEWWDGSGYPRKLKGEDIPLEARIIAVADVFDALVTKRCYKEAYSFDKAFNMVVSESGTHFDPFIIDCFVKAKDRVLEAYNRLSDPQEAGV